MKMIEFQNRKYTLLGDTRASTFLMYLIDESNPEDYKQIYQKLSDRALGNLKRHYFVI